MSTTERQEATFYYRKPSWMWTIHRLGRENDTLPERLALKWAYKLSVTAIKE